MLFKLKKIKTFIFVRIPYVPRFIKYLNIQQDNIKVINLRTIRFKITYKVQLIEYYQHFLSIGKSKHTIT